MSTKWIVLGLRCQLLIQYSGVLLWWQVINSFDQFSAWSFSIESSEIERIFFPPICFDMLKMIFVCQLKSTSWGIYREYVLFCLWVFFSKSKFGNCSMVSCATPLIIAEAHYPTLLRPRSEGREFSLLATAFDPEPSWEKVVIQWVLIESGALKTIYNRFTVFFGVTFGYINIFSIEILLTSCVLKHGWLGNPRPERRVLMRKSSINGGFSIAICDYQGEKKCL